MKVNQCRLCKGNLSKPKLKLPPTPLANEFVKTLDPQDLFPLEICVCESCKHYQLNEQVDPERMFKNYYYVAGTSPVNVEHFRQYAVHMIEKFDLKPNSKILDIASNDGTLLQHFKNLGMDVLGIDPAENLAKEANKNGIPTINEFFTNEYATQILNKYGQFDLITANNVFAHVPDMIGFAKGVKKLLKPNGVFTFEVSYFADVCDKTLFDTIYHEHTSYHTITPLISFFNLHKMKLFDVEHISNHGGSVRISVQQIYGNHSSYGSDINYLIDEERDIDKRVLRLNKDIKLLGYELREKLQQFKAEGKSIAIYGVPAKATTLMYALGIDEKMIDFAVDDAPLKQGTFTPGKHIPVYTSQAIIQHKPDVLLILAWNFADSIIENCKKLWRDNISPGGCRYPTFIVPLPELKIQRYCEDKICTCGQGPWDIINEMMFGDTKITQAKCQSCGGIDMGLPLFIQGIK